MGFRNDKNGQEGELKGRKLRAEWTFYEIIKFEFHRA